LREALGRAAERRAGQEDHQGDLEHDLAAVKVAELAVHGRHRRLRQQIRGDHPGDVVEASEVADDRRQRRRDDRLIERGHQQHEHQAREHDEDALVSVGGGGPVYDSGPAGGGCDV
jgi:hypothetical protein